MSQTKAQNSFLAKLGYPSQIRQIKELIINTNTSFNNAFPAENYQYYRYLGTNIYEALGFLYLEEILIRSNLPFFVTWLDRIRSKEANIFENCYFSTKTSIEFIQAEEIGISILESYLDSLLNNKTRENRQLLATDFWFKAQQNLNIRIFAGLIPRKMISLFCYEDFEFAKKAIKMNELKVLNIDSNEYSEKDLIILVYSFNFIIQYDEIEQHFLKKHFFNAQILGREHFGKISFVKYQENYITVYSKNENLELQIKIMKKYQENNNSAEIQKKTTNIPQENLKNNQINQKNDIILQENSQMSGKKSLLNKDKEEEKPPESTSQESYMNNLMSQHNRKHAEVNDSKKSNFQSPQKKNFRENLLIQQSLNDHSSNKKKEEEEEKIEKVSERNHLKNKVEAESNSVEKSSPIKKNCLICFKSNHNDEKPLFLIKHCHHPICFDCLLKQYYSPNPLNNSRFSCPSSPCRNIYFYSEIELYFQEIQIEESKKSFSSSPNKEKLEEDSNETLKKSQTKEINSGKNQESSSGKKENHYKTDKSNNIASKNTNEEEISDHLTNKKESTASTNYDNEKDFNDNHENQPLRPSNVKSRVSINKESKVLCVICQQYVQQTIAFLNPQCFHAICPSCVEANLLKKCKEYTYCKMKNCFKLVTKKDLEAFIQEKGKNKLDNLPAFVCSYCLKESFLNEEDCCFDFHKCKFCRKNSCLLHKGLLSECFCYCEMCGIATEKSFFYPTKRICVDCLRKYCLLCKETGYKCNCYCKKCGEILNKTVSKQQKCEKCVKHCDSCGLEIKKEANTFIIKNCGHKFCKECTYENLEKLKKNSCILNHYSYH